MSCEIEEASSRHADCPISPSWPPSLPSFAPRGTSPTSSRPVAARIPGRPASTVSDNDRCGTWSSSHLKQKDCSEAEDDDNVRRGEDLHRLYALRVCYVLARVDDIAQHWEDGGGVDSDGKDERGYWGEERREGADGRGSARRFFDRAMSTHPSSTHQRT